MIRELMQPFIESLLRGEVDVLAARKRSQLMRRILLQRIHRHHQQTDRSASTAVLQIVQNLRLSWPKRNRINDRVRPPQRGNHLSWLGLAAMVASLADQEDRV